MIELKQWSTTLHSPPPHARALAAVIETLAASNNHARIVALVDRAQFHTRGSSSEEIVKALANAGHYDRAEALARTITDTDRQTLTGGSGSPGAQARALAHVVAALGKAGRYHRAEVLARTVNKPEIQARNLVELAESIYTIEASESNREPAMADTKIPSPNSLLAHAFLLGQWSNPLQALAKIHPDTLGPIADEVSTAFKLRSTASG
ncbi:MAG: hypothetical protein J2P17_20075 [Mycobacterium sp.]|nr:hypothetical protein [Mycobacterium sp.]